MVDARSLTRSLGGRWHGKSGMACCPAHKDRSPSLSIKDGYNGRPVFHCFAGCDWRDVEYELVKQGLLPKWQPDKDNTNFKPKRKKAPTTPTFKPPKTVDLNDPDTKEKRGWAYYIWQKTIPIDGTLGEAYLRERGITMKWPSVRFHPRLKHKEGRYWPALVIAYHRLNGDFDGIQRIFLNPETAKKAPVKEPKLSLGTSLGSAMRFGDLTSWPETIDGLETQIFCELGTTEGPEDGMSVAQMYDLPVWASGGGERMANIELPQPLAGLWVYRDNDEEGQGQRFAKQTIDKHYMKVLGFFDNPDRYGIVAPDAGFKDFNNVLVAQLARI